MTPSSARFNAFTPYSRALSGRAFAEYVPLILLMMALLEYQQLAGWQLHAIGATLVFARLIHGIALSFTRKWFFGRFFGTVLTFTLLATCGILCVVQGVRGIGI